MVWQVVSTVLEIKSAPRKSKDYAQHGLRKKYVLEFSLLPYRAIECALTDSY